MGKKKCFFADVMTKVKSVKLETLKIYLKKKKLSNLKHKYSCSLKSYVFWAIAPCRLLNDPEDRNLHTYRCENLQS